jgi:hypothetical protein
MSAVRCSKAVTANASAPSVLVGMAVLLAVVGAAIELVHRRIG